MRIHDDSETRLKDYGRYLEVLQRSPATVRTYLLQVRHFLGWIQARGITDPVHVTWKDVEDHAAWMVSRYKPASITTRLRAVRGFYDFLVAHDIIKVNPARLASHYRAGYQLPKTVLTEDEVRALLEAPDTDTREGIRDRTMLEVLYASGPRVSELCNLDVDDADLDAGFLHINRGKGGKSRTVPLSHESILWLRLWVEYVRPQLAKLDETALFVGVEGKRINLLIVERLIKAYGQKAGIPKKVTPHALRHALASHLIWHGASIRHVKDVMRHELLSTTEQYVHIADVELRRVVDECHPRSHLRAA